MTPTPRPIALLPAALLFAFVAAGPLSAQSHQQVVSANPFGLLLEFFNAEYERVVGAASTAGVGGSFLRNDDQDYLNADAFFRFYPVGTPLDGWAFGAKVGVTRIPNSGSYLGYGFDVNRSWLLGADARFYVGVGLGLKRLVGARDDVDWIYIPTIRLLNVGYAF